MANATVAGQPAIMRPETERYVQMYLTVALRSSPDVKKKMLDGFVSALDRWYKLKS